MKIELHEITVREIAEGYIDNAENGVTGYGGKLNIRPKYQREFVYDDKKRSAVIETIVKGFPLNECIGSKTRTVILKYWTVSSGQSVSASMFPEIFP